MLAGNTLPVLESTEVCLRKVGDFLRSQVQLVTEQSQGCLAQAWPRHLAGPWEPRPVWADLFLVSRGKH